jgi:hypothetical protein
MRRRVSAIVIGTIGVLSVTAALAAGASTPAIGTRAVLENFACHPALRPVKRSVSVTAVMRPVSGTSAMQMRFELISDAGDRLSPVHGSGLDKWLSPQPSTLGQNPKDVWIVRHPVKRLAVPADYRFRVSFRWLGGNHRTIATATRASARCSQPDMRPDPLVRSIAVDPIGGDSAHDRYVAVIANDGLTGIKNLQVQFTPGGGGTKQTATITKLDPNRTYREAFVGPVCTATTAPTVTVDPNHLLDDLDPSNDSLLATCPSATASSGTASSATAPSATASSATASSATASSATASSAPS